MPNLLILREFGPVACILFCAIVAQSQPLTGPSGADAWMLGGASSSTSNVWSICNNPAGMSGVQQTTIGVYTRQQFALSELKTGSIAFVKPFSSLSAGISLSYYGFDAFNQQRYTCGLSKSLSKKLRLGVQALYLGTFIRDYGSSGNWLLGLGLQVQPLQSITLGVYLFNPTRSSYSSHTKILIPTYARLGCTYTISEKVKMLLEAEQQLEQQLIWRGGIHYRIHDILHLAIGASTQPTHFTFGVQLKVVDIQIDLTTSIHQVLGFSPHLGLSMPLQ